MFPENGQELYFGDGVESVDGVLPGKVVDGVDLSQVLGAPFEEFFVEEVETGVGVELNVEVVAGGAVGLEQEGLVVLVNDEQVVQPQSLPLLLHHLPISIIAQVQ